MLLLFLICCHDMALCPVFAPARKGFYTSKCSGKIKRRAGNPHAFLYVEIMIRGRLLQRVFAVNDHMNIAFVERAHCFLHVINIHGTRAFIA